jgi:hypothetical protein
MDQTMLRMMELDYKGYHCSQIMLILALEAQGKSNSDLVRAMGGLAHGSEFDRGTCGTLTGAACFLGLYAGKGSDDEYEDENLKYMLKDLGNWFAQTFGRCYGDVTCEAIVGDRTKMRQRCAVVVEETYAKVTELLIAGGYDISIGR